MKILVSGSRCARAGFTILEVLIAMGILLFGMTAIIGLLTFGAALSRTAQLRTTAASAMEAVVADLEETLFPLIESDAGGTDAGPPKPIQGRALGGMDQIVYSATPFQNPDDELEYRVDVELAWKTQGVQREKRFSTILVREIPFGERLRKRFVEGLKPPEQTAIPAGMAETQKKKP